MNEREFTNFLEDVALTMRDYSNFRTGGNMGTAIQGYLTLKGAEKVAEQLSRIADGLEKINNRTGSIGEVKI